MLATFAALALAAVPAIQTQDSDGDQALAHGQVWSAMRTDTGCLATGDADGGSGASLGRDFAAPARLGLDLSGAIARRHAGRTGIPILARFLAGDGRELGRVGLRMAATPDGRDLYADSVPDGLIGRMRGAARVEFSDGSSTLGFELADLPAALDEFDRCMAAAPRAGE